MARNAATINGRTVAGHFRQSNAPEISFFMKKFRSFSSLSLLIVAPLALSNSSCAQNAAAPATNITAPAITAPAQAATPTMSIPLTDEAAFFDALDLDLPALKEVKAAVAAQDYDAAKQAWAKHLETRTDPKWLWSHADKAKIIALLAQKGDDLSEHIAPADLVLARTFNPQGKVRQMNKDINWILAGEETHVLSRFAYFNDLGLAYWKTGDAKYATDFAYILHDWIANNPAPTDLSAVTKPNTTWRTLETGIRVTEWCNDMQLFMDAPQFDAQAKYEMSKSLMEHARYLCEWTPKFRGGNWQVIEATGLATAGIMLPEARAAKAWRERGLLRLTEHMEQDILPDGGHSELTPSYHQWVMQQYANTAQLAKINGIAAAGLTARHEKMYQWLLSLSQPDSIVPPIGDTHDPLDIRDDMATGALMYHRPDFKFLGAKSGPASWVWLFGADAFDQYQQMPSKKPDFTSVLLADSKYAIMRNGWNANDPYFLFNAAPTSFGHAHADKLDVLAYAGRALIVDPGIYSYGEPLSTSYFREPQAHNGVMIDGKGVERSRDATTFGRLLAWQSTGAADFAAGDVNFGGFHVQRSVAFVKPGYAVVVDYVTGAPDDNSEHEISRRFHFPIGAEIEQGNMAGALPNIAYTGFKSGTNLQIQVADKAQLKMDKGWIPTEPANAVEAPVANYGVKAKLPLILVAVLTPFDAPHQLPTVTNLSSPDSIVAHIRLSFAGGQTDEIMVAPRAMKLQIGAQSQFGRALIVRRGPQANGVAALDGSMKVAATAPVAPPAPIVAGAQISASSQQHDYPATLPMDGNAETFWVSSGTTVETGPTAQKPQWLQMSFAKPQSATGVRIVGRAGYGPKSGEVQVSDDGKSFRKIADFNLKDGEPTTVRFAPTIGKFFRVLIASAHDVGSESGSRNVQVCEVGLVK